MTAEATRTVVDAAGDAIALGAELGRGGEGIVYVVSDRPEVVAKLYHALPGEAKAAKLAAMASLGTERLLRLTAWPLGTLHREPGSPVAGLLMPRIDGHKAIHTLYSPKSRLTAFPQASYPFLVHAAANAARAFAVIHDHGHVIGDVNHGNLVISPQATAKLIDCDSFQIAAGERLYRCEVGVATHTPPELQGKSFREVTRSANHDAFGLAVIVFQLLFMGRHPFSGAYSGPGEMPLERSISEFRFAYSQHAATYQMRPPPATPALDTVTPEIAALFERAFADAGATGGRPSPQEWVEALTAFGQSLTRCEQSRAHHYLQGLPACPWCRIERKAGVLLFGLAAYDVTKAQASFNVTATWAQIAAVARPEQVALPVHTLPPSPQVAEALGMRRRWRFATTAIGLMGSVGMFAVNGGQIETDFGGFFPYWMIVSGAAGLYQMATRNTPRNFTTGLARARREHAALVAQWEREASPQRFDQALQQLDERRKQYRDLHTIRQRRLDELGGKAREQQLERFLDTFVLARADIDGIGPARVATLQSYGVETASDIEERAIKAIPGFGPAYTERLIDWRRSVEARFRFDATRVLQRADIQAVDWGIEVERIELERDLRAGAKRLADVKAQIITARERLWPELDEAARQLAQAEADARALGR